MHKVHFTTLHIVYIINCCTYSKLSLKLESLKFLLYLVDVFCKSTILLLPTVLHLSWHVPSDYDEVIILNIIRSPSWLTITEYLCHKWQQICSVCYRHNPVILSSCITYNHIFNKSMTTGVTSRATTIAYPSRAFEFQKWHDIYWCHIWIFRM